MKVPVSIEHEDVEGDYVTTDGLRLTCGRCGHYVDVLGITDRSARRGACLLRDECPNGESNLYDVDWWAD